ncbi:MAG: efflux transporter, family, subunit [Myxococcaceae bacterium]|nr:efflux transporter, family, subunit [Myxococcaceae bacterium]
MEQRKRRRLVGRIITTTVLVGAVALIGVGFVPKPVTVSVGKVEQRSLEVTVDEPGKTRIRTKYVISAPVTGQLSRIALQAGDVVEVGDVVAEISPVAPQLLDERTRAQASARAGVAQSNLARAQSAIARAQTGLTFRRDQAKRSQQLFAEGGTSKQALEQAEYGQRSAEDEFAAAQLSERVAANELEAAKAALASMSGGKSGTKLPVTAPVAGQVLRVYQESEGVVQPGTPLVELGDARALEVVVDVLSSDAVRIEVGAEARIERWGGDRPLAARVRKKEPSAFTTRSALGVEEQRVPVLLDIVEDPSHWSSLGDGYRLEAHIRVAKIEAAVVAPASALFREEGAWSAFAVHAGQAKKTSVEVGARTPDWVEIKRGLGAGVQVVLYPSDQVVDGVKLAPEAAPRQ